MNKRILTLIGLFLIGAALFATAQIAPDTDANVRVQTEVRVKRVVFEYDNSGNLVKATDYIYVLVKHNGVVVEQKQLDSCERSVAELSAAKPVMVNGLSGYPVWSKNNWPVTPANP